MNKIPNELVEIERNGVGGRIKRETSTKDRKSWRAMISHVLKGLGR